MRPSPPGLICAELLTAPREAILQEVVHDLVIQPLAGAQGLHAPTLDRVSSSLVVGGAGPDKDLRGQAYALCGPDNHTPFLGHKGLHKLHCLLSTA